jgi:hypothetical protein
MCAEYFALVFGISSDKLGAVRGILGSNTILAPRAEPLRPRVKYAHTYAFWKIFFENCQKPNDYERLFPVNESYLSIYEDFYLPWCTQVKVEPVCISYFKEVRRDEDFSNVKRRPRHHHARCLECANLQTRRLQAFRNLSDKTAWQAEWRDHHNEKRQWRLFYLVILLVFYSRREMTLK